jgi:hypothetical protein
MSDKMGEENMESHRFKIGDEVIYRTGYNMGPTVPAKIIGIRDILGAPVYYLDNGSWCYVEAVVELVSSSHEDLPNNVFSLRGRLPKPAIVTGWKKPVQEFTQEMARNKKKAEDLRKKRCKDNKSVLRSYRIHTNNK